MKNKVLIKLIVPMMDRSFDLFIPVNETVGKIKKLMINSISDITRVQLANNKEYILINKDTAETYDNNKIVIDTNIRNATELVLLVL
jgi:hypothetical protein